MHFTLIYGSDCFCFFGRRGHVLPFAYWNDPKVRVVDYGPEAQAIVCQSLMVRNRCLNDRPTFRKPVSPDPRQRLESSLPRMK
jgi:hypothetical protein